MAALNTFVANYVPLELRHTRDFTGARGWCDLGNQIIRRFEQEGLLDRDRKVEVPVFIENTFYPNEIFLPSDCNRPLKLFVFDSTNPEDDSKYYEFREINGRLRLESEYTDTALADSTTRKTNGGESIVSTTLDVYGTGDDLWRWYGVWFQAQNWNTANVDRLSCADARLVWHSNDSTDSIFFRPELPSAPNTGDYVYFFTDFLMLRYEKKYANLSAADTEIPVYDNFEPALAHGMCMLACKIGSKERRAYERDFELDLLNLGKETFTPSEEQARPQPRPWPDYNSTPTSTTHTWTGDS